MDFITTGIIASTVYDILKKGLKVSAEKLQDRLGQSLKNGAVAEAVAEELARLGINDDMSEIAINRNLEKSLKITNLIRDINAQVPLFAPSAITKVTQTHSGSGDNVAGNKIVQ